MLYKSPFKDFRVRQASNIYGVSIPTIWSWLKECRIPKLTKIGGSTKWLNI